MEPHFRKYQINHKFYVKKTLEIEKKEIKTLNTFQKLLE